MSNDPTEQRNLAEEHPMTVRRLMALLTAHNSEQADPAWPSRVETPITIDSRLEDAQSPDDEHAYWPN